MWWYSARKICLIFHLWTLIVFVRKNTWEGFILLLFTLGYSSCSKQRKKRTVLWFGIDIEERWWREQCSKLLWTEKYGKGRGDKKPSCLCEGMKICTEERRNKQMLMAKQFLSDKGKWIIIFNNLNFNETNHS